MTSLGHRVRVYTPYGQLLLYHPEKAEVQRKFEWQGSMLVLAWSPDAKYIATELGRWREVIEAAKIKVDEQ